MLPPPPPPPPAGMALNTGGQPYPLIIVEGKKISKEDMDKLDPSTIESMSVLKGESALKAHGQEGENGVIEIKLKKASSSDAAKPLSDKLVIVDGVEYKSDLNNIDPGTIESVNVLSGDAATTMYGDRGKAGVVIVTSKNSGQAAVPQSTMQEIVVVGYGNKNAGDSKPVEPVNSKEPIVVRGYPLQQDKAAVTAPDQLPVFQGEADGALRWVASNIRYPAEARNRNISGDVLITFLVTSKGKVERVKVIKSVDPSIDAEAKRVVESMPEWKPGTLGGKPVDVQMTLPVKFQLK